MTFEDEPAAESERSEALDAWVAAFDREMEQSGDFSTSVAAIRAHGCFDVRAAVERWVLVNPTGDATVAQLQPARAEIVPLQAALEAQPVLEGAVAPVEPAATSAERTSPRPEAAPSPDVAYFHSLLQGGIERAQLDEAFPGLGLVIDEAAAQHEASAPILSEVPPAPSREDLNDEIRGMRQEFQTPGTRSRRRWRARD